MHLLYSSTLGTDVIDNTDHQVQGHVVDLLFDVDKGKVIALFVAGAFSRDVLLLQTQDIASWGNRVHIRDIDTLGPAEDVVRLMPYLEDDRTLIRQTIQTESGAVIGKCVDVQFRTDTFAIEWIFPKRFFRKGIALPASDILEITKDAIVVKNQGPREEKERIVEQVEEVELQGVASPAAGRIAKRYTRP